MLLSNDFEQQFNIFALRTFLLCFASSFFFTLVIAEPRTTIRFHFELESNFSFNCEWFKILLFSLYILERRQIVPFPLYFTEVNVKRLGSSLPVESNWNGIGIVLTAGSALIFSLRWISLFPYLHRIGYPTGILTLRVARIADLF